MADAFEGMSQGLFRLATVEAENLALQARVLVLTRMVQEILARQGVTTIQGAPVHNYVHAQIQAQVQELLASLADHRPARASQIHEYLRTFAPGILPEPPS